MISSVYSLSLNGRGRNANITRRDIPPTTPSYTGNKQQIDQMHLPRILNIAIKLFFSIPKYTNNNFSTAKNPENFLSPLFFPVRVKVLCHAMILLGHAMTLHTTFVLRHSVCMLINVRQV